MRDRIESFLPNKCTRLTKRTLELAQSMTLKDIIWTIALIAVSLAAVYSRSARNFRFDLDHLDNAERERLFSFLDQNSDRKLCKSEVKELFRYLFESSEDNDNYVCDPNEEILLDALDISDKGIEKSEFIDLWNNWIKVILKPKSALIVVDVQNDFIDNVTYKGHLYVKQSEKIVPIINNMIRTVPFDLIVYTQDWHPSNHCSFIESVRNESIKREIISPKKPKDEYQVGDPVFYAKHPKLEQRLWPSHCVANTYGAALYNGSSNPLIIAKNSIRVFKGTDSEIDSYSAFMDNDQRTKTALHKELLKRGMTSQN